MNSSPAVLEIQLVQAYREENAVYAQALGLAEKMAGGLGTRTPPDSTLTDMLAALDTIAGIEARIAPVKQLWCQQQCHPGAELRALLDQAAQLILQLTAQVQQAEQFAAAHKARLSPELDAASRGRQMQQAYGQVMTNTRMSQSCPIQR